MNKHNIDNQAVTHYFNFIFKGYQYNTTSLDHAEKKNIERGIKKEKIHIAKNMLSGNFDIQSISKVTRLSEKDIKIFKEIFEIDHV